MLTTEERHDETQFTTKIGGKTSLGPSDFEQRHDETQFTTKIGGKTSLGTSYFVL
jgi:hypothetical protein